MLWTDVLAAIELVDELSELQTAFDNPPAFLRRVEAAATPTCRRFLVAKLRPRLEPITNQQGLDWADVLRALEAIDEPSELKEALSDPDAFLQRLAAAAGPVAKKLLIARLRPALQPTLAKQGIKWEDVRVALELVDEPHVLRAAVEDPQGFLIKLASHAGAVAIQLCLARLRPKLEPLIHKQGLEWADVLRALEVVDDPKELEEAITHPERFLEKADGRLGKKMLLARVRPRLEPVTNRLGLRWEDVVAALEHVDELHELHEAIEEPEDFFRKMLEEVIGPAAVRILVARLRPVLEPMLRKEVGVLWTDVSEVLLAAEEASLRGILINPKAFIDKLREDQSSGKGSEGGARSLQSISTAVHSSQIVSANAAVGGPNAAVYEAADPQASAGFPPALGNDAGNADATGGGLYGGRQLSGISLPSASTPVVDFSEVNEKLSSAAAMAQEAFKAVGEAWTSFGEALSGPMFRILIALYQVLRPLGPVFEIRCASHGLDPSSMSILPRLLTLRAHSVCVLFGRRILTSPRTDPAIYVDFLAYFGAIELDCTYHGAYTLDQPYAAASVCSDSPTARALVW